MKYPEYPVSVVSILSFLQMFIRLFNRKAFNLDSVSLYREKAIKCVSA